MTELQSKILDIFIEVQRICEKNNLRYFAIYGTCLGAVRHKGFIPWDDDFDIAMPYSDYQKFMGIAPTQLKYPYKLLSMGGLEHSTCVFSKVHNVETTLIEPEELPYPDSYKGVYIDIFAMSGLPGNRLARKIFLAKTKFILYSFMFSRRHQTAMKSWKRKLYYLCIVKPISMISNDFWYHAVINLSARYGFEGSNKVICIATPINLSCREWFDDKLYVEFETIKIPIPQGYDQHLRTEYGDYMTPPPETDRVPLHGNDGIVDLNRPYSYYQSKHMERI